ncbi:hypothetical protein KY092_08430 [Natronomonas gomsonensis]|uniref:hypothetical protein n=1 Tax=Natronomonas gomsonensis TaxID=1046043 RepID=UPI0020CA3885|nr:hypothetical protein [Natronomonas gomsonensis]MCY4730584.1 hypothetical protein [Natronomonas gomsonensis]
MGSTGETDLGIEELDEEQFSEKDVREKTNGQKVVTVSAGCDIEAGEEAVVIRSSLFNELREVLDI